MKIKVSPRPGKFFESDELLAGVKAIREAVVDQDIMLIEGPPGTGKTIIFEVAKAHLAGQSGSFRIIDLVPHHDLTISAIARIMLHALGLPGRRYTQDCVNELRVGLRNFQDSGITTALFVDNSQLLPPLVWGQLKFFNELRLKGEEVGPAVVAAGIDRKKIPISVQARAEFFRASGLGLEERKDFLTYLFHRIQATASVAFHLAPEKVDAAVKNNFAPLSFVRLLKREFNEARRLRKPIPRSSVSISADVRARRQPQEVV